MGTNDSWPLPSSFGEPSSSETTPDGSQPLPGVLEVIAATPGFKLLDGGRTESPRVDQLYVHKIMDDGALGVYGIGPNTGHLSVTYRPTLLDEGEPRIRDLTAEGATGVVAITLRTPNHEYQISLSSGPFVNPGEGVIEVPMEDFLARSKYLASQRETLLKF